MLPRQVHFLDGPPRQTELGVGQRHQPRPAIGLLWSPHAWRGPVEGLFAEAVGVLQIKACERRRKNGPDVGIKAGQ